VVVDYSDVIKDNVSGTRKCDHTMDVCHGRCLRTTHNSSRVSVDETEWTISSHLLPDCTNRQLPRLNILYDSLEHLQDKINDGKVLSILKFLRSKQ
jgi:hypothetical protein